ncbi:NRDE family protein, partial [Cecembia sp.]|uniref:NRDE family protein n=1 Tax=Cecembia sp. TaxID=1898110 RepID=UPI0025C4EA49
RFAAITNYRDLKNKREFSKSRGDLVKNFLEKEVDPKAYLEEIEKEKMEYEGFNLLVADQEGLYYLSNKVEGVRQLSPGLYGLSNAVLETPWPKLTKAKENLAKHIAADSFDPLSLMKGQQSKETCPLEILPDTGATPEQEKLLSAQFINVGNYYGTVNSTVLLWKYSGEVDMMERKFDQVAETHQDTKVSFKVKNFLEQKQS